MLNDKMIPTHKIKVELEYTSSIDTDQKGLIVKLSHPDLQGHLYLRSSSSQLAEVQLNHLNTDKVPAKDPLHNIVDSANKLIESVSELKQIIGS